MTSLSEGLSYFEEPDKGKRFLKNDSCFFHLVGAETLGSDLSDSFAARPDRRKTRQVSHQERHGQILAVLMLTEEIKTD